MGESEFKQHTTIQAELGGMVVLMFLQDVVLSTDRISSFGLFDVHVQTQHMIGKLDDIPGIRRFVSS